MKVVWSEPADAQLEAIVEYIANDNVQAALALDDMLHQAADTLQQFPNKGRPGRVPETRELVAHPTYLLVYTLGADCVTIVGVLHTSRQYPPD